jgi:cellulose biosynthesis protein BcsQ
VAAIKKRLRAGEMKPQRKRKIVRLELEEGDKSLFERVRAGGTKAVCFFNNKGGVGKTTLVANLASELSFNFGAKILVVDADPQCNLTQYVLEEDESYEIFSSSNISSIYSVIRPLSLGKGYNEKLPIRKASNFGFDIIIGDPRLALQEDLLAQDWRDAKAGGMRGIKTTYVFADVVKKAKSAGYDFVFFDMGPSLGAINRSVLLTTDYFVVPMSIDIFSVWAIKNIGTTVGVWQRELQVGRSLAEDPAEVKDLSDNRKIRFLGYVTQQHKERTEKSPIKTIKGAEVERERRIVRAYQEINDSFPAEVQHNLGSFFVAKTMEPHLGNIRHLSSLAPRSQTQHLPMVNVKGAGIYTSLRKQAREIYRGIARRFLSNLQS